jgi:acylphosphatase
VEGRVQGVFYRNWTQQTARAFGLRGWVRNRTDGSVEILASGQEMNLEKLVEHCRTGPPAARVVQLTIEDSDEALPVDFEIWPTL